MLVMTRVLVLVLERRLSFVRSSLPIVLASGAPLAHTNTTGGGCRWHQPWRGGERAWSR